MTTYYKAVREDGTSFWNGTTRWNLGKVTVHDQGVGSRSANARFYLSVSVDPANCTGLSWPCKLLIVEPVEGHPVWTPDSEEMPSKRAATAWKVTGERPAHEVFGPQGEQIAALIERVRQLTYDEAWKLSAARSAARDAAWGAARDAAWGAARSAARDAAWGAAWGAAGGAAWGAAWSAAWDAALGLLVRDLISKEYYDKLTLPWRSVIGQIHPDDEPA